MGLALLTPLNIKHKTCSSADFKCTLSLLEDKLFFDFDTLGGSRDIGFLFEIKTVRISADPLIMEFSEPA